MTVDILSWNDWHGLALGPPDWLVPGLLERGGGALIHGGPRSFKSFFMLQLCLDLAAGYSPLGVFPAVPQKRTLLFQAEGTKRAWKKRMDALWSGYPSDLPFWSRHTATEKFDTPAGSNRMLKALDLIKPDLLVLDPIAEFLDGADTDAVAVQRWTSTINSWREAAGCAVFLVHHDRQPLRFSAKGEMRTLDAGMEEARGNTRITAWADCIIGLRRKDETTTARVQKVRDSPDGQEFSFTLVGGKLIVTSRADALEQTVLGLVVGELWLADLLRECALVHGVHERTARRAIDRLVDRGELVKKAVGGRFQLNRALGGA